jgi:aminoglycoside 6-adenylyltransferase
MKSFPRSYPELEAAILDWAFQNPGLQLALVVGSRARSQPPADQWSDLDLILFFDDPAPWTGQNAWLGAFGKIELAYSHAIPAGDVEWLVLYDSGLKADFMVARFPPHVKNKAERREYLLHGPFKEVLAFGLRLLVDKRSEFGDLAEMIEPAGGASLPDEATFTTSLHRFWMNCTRVAKFLRRGDLWRAKMLCDCTMKQDTLTLLEWFALAKGASSGQVWYEGRNLPNWADASALEALPTTFGRYESADLWRALYDSMHLFQHLAQECSQRLGYPYPKDLEERILGLVQGIQTENANQPSNSCAS